MTWWFWVLLGLVLLAAEVATPGGFFAFFFGLSGLVVGGLVALEVAGPTWLQWVLFAVIAIGALALLRGPLQARMNVSTDGKAVDSLVGEAVIVTAEIPAGGSGKVELRGSPWNARTGSGRTLAVGQRCVVARIEGLTLWVQPEV